MASKNKSERSLDLLDKKIKALREKATQLEGQIDDNFTYLQEHSAVLLINSLFPRKLKAKASLREDGLIQAFLNNEGLSNALNRLISKLAEKTSEFVNKLIDKWLE